MEPSVLIKLNALDNTKAAFASLKKNLDGVTDKMSPMKKDLEALEPAFKKMALVGTAAFAGIVGISGKALQAYAEVERSQRQLEHAVVAVSKGTKEQVARINELTAALEKKAGVDADSLNMGVAQLSTFGLSTDAVIGLTKSLADLTVNQSGLNATSDDYIQSANNIAKALNGQFGVLERSGIRFSEAQRNLILYGTETEKVKALQEGFAQNLRETTDTVGGVDLAMAKLRVTMGNIQENLGKALAPAFAQLAETVQPLVEKLANWAEQNPDLVAKIVLATAAVAGLAVVVGTLALTVGLLLSPITLVIAGFAALVAGIYVVSTQWQTLPGILQTVLFPLKVVVEAVQFLYETITWVFNAVKEPVAASVDYMQLKFQSFMDWITEKVDYVVKQVRRALAALESLPGVRTAVSISSKAFSSVSDMFRAKGGPVTGNSPYIVGEVGPELFVPNTSGRIIPNNQLAGVGAGGTNIYLTITGNSFLGERDMAEKIGDQLIRIIKQNARL
jgi:uncharacterized membrane protein